jgi:6-phosphogluconolactonase
LYDKRIGEKSGFAVSATPRELLIGSYTEILPHVEGRGRGIYGAEFSSDVAVAREPALIVDAVSPSWLVASDLTGCVYATNETKRFSGVDEGGVSAYARDPETAALVLINSVNSGGVEPAHLALDPSGRYLVAANYRSGSVITFALRADGGVGEIVSREDLSGRGPHPVRQTSPHPHQVVFDPVDGTLLVPDLGTDAIVRYRLGVGGNLVEVPDGRIELPPGSGPRHLCFAPDGSRFAVACELASAVAIFERNGDSFTLIRRVSSSRMRVSAPNSASEVAFSDSGRSVLVSNRGADTLAVFAVSERGELEMIDEVASGGRWPRSFSFVAKDRVVVANQNTDSVDSFSFDEETNDLHWISRVSAPTPAALLVI